MKRIINYIFLILFVMIINAPIVSADESGSMSVYANANTVKPGQTVRISIKLSEVAGVFSIKSSNESVLSGSTSKDFDTLYTTETFTVTFTAKSVGTATITVTPTDASSTNEKPFTSSKSVTIKVINDDTKIYNYNNNNNNNNNKTNNNTKKDLSSVNTLSSLSIDGFKFDKEFNKDTTEYNVEVPSETTKVNIKASATDENATISGTGEKEVKEGNNKLEVKVTAENGDVKTYIINVKVKELNPINVKIDEKEYTVVRKEDGLEIPENFEKTTVKIDNEDVLAFKNENLKLTLVALKDKDGNTKFYIYDNGKYQEFIVLEAKGFKIIVLDFPKDKILKGFIKSEFNANEIKYIGYVNNKKSKYYLVYGKNYETGKDNIYQYDSEEGTLQRFNTDKLSVNKVVSNNYKLPFIIVSVILGLVIIGIGVYIIISNKNRSNPKLKLKKSKKGINY